MLNITLLGEQAVVDPATERIRTRSVRSVALLGLLVARTGSPQSRAAIAGSFWPESGDAQALTNLRRELHHLRRMLGDDDGALEVTSTHLCWHDRGRHRVDLSVFLRERDAALAATDDEAVVRHGLAAFGQYAGDLLPGLDDAWLDDVRAELRESCTALCDRVSDAARSSGRPRAAIEALRKRISVDPYDEDAHRTLMEVQAGRGDRAGAIRTFHRLSTVLEHDLAVPPGEETLATLARIMGAGEAGTRTTTPPPTARSGPGRAGLVGREAELHHLLEVWDRAAAGRAGVVVVQGGAGVGKTRLLSELVTHARGQGAVVALTRCFDSTGRLSLSPVADWLREPTVSAARARLDRTWQDEADRLVPSTADATSVLAAEAGTREANDVWQRHRFFEGVARALLASGRPLLLVLDDVQWCDADTLSFTAFLLNLAPGAPVLLAVTSRSAVDSADPLVEPWLSGLRAGGVLNEVALGPLDEQQTAALAGSVTGAEIGSSEATLLYDATGGFPLFVVEAARSARAAGVVRAERAGDWADILRRRLQLVSPAAREVAGLASALGRDFSLELLVEASDLTADTVVLAVDELWRHRILRQFQDGYDFSHDLLREASYTMVSPPRRWLLHRRLAQALELRRAAGSEAVAAQLAEQYRLAGNGERALTYYLQAADATAKVFAHAEALTLLRSALTLLEMLPPGRERDERELRCLVAAAPVMLAQHGYTLPELEQTCARTIELAERLGRPEQRVTAMVALWSTVWVSGRLQEAYDIATQAVALVRPGDPRFGQAHFSLAGTALHLGQPQLSFEHFEVAHASMGTESLSLGTRARVHTAGWWAHAAYACGQPELAADLARAAVDEGRASGHQYSYVVAVAYAAITHQLLGDRAGCLSAAGEVRRLCDRYQFGYYGEWGRVLEGWCLGGTEGVALAEQGIATLERQGALARMPYWLSLLAQIVPEADTRADLMERANAFARTTHEEWVGIATAQAALRSTTDPSVPSQVRRSPSPLPRP